LDQLVTIELFGQPYTFKADSDYEKAKLAADTLVEEVSKVESQQAGRSSGVTKLTILLLAALNIANENYELKAKYSELCHNVFERSNNLIRLLDTPSS
jgi:cell division protein ZapA (FtsZ GTPase activity inhibitor)